MCGVPYNKITLSSQNLRSTFFTICNSQFNYYYNSNVRPLLRHLEIKVSLPISDSKWRFLQCFLPFHAYSSSNILDKRSSYIYSICLSVSIIITKTSKQVLECPTKEYCTWNPSSLHTLNIFCRFASHGPRPDSNVM